MARAYACDRCGEPQKESFGKTEVEALRGARLYIFIAGNPNYPAELCAGCAIYYLEQVVNRAKEGRL